VAPNLLEQRFEPTAPNQQWLVDITYVPSGEGWLYLAGIKDVFTCEIVGNCHDNAPMESFWGSLKNELTHHQPYATRAHARPAIREYIEIFYNRRRRHSRLGYVSPAVFADTFKHLQAA
jgi:transposase InsO family protein